MCRRSRLLCNTRSVQRSLQHAPLKGIPRGRAAARPSDEEGARGLLAHVSPQGPVEALPEVLARGDGREHGAPRGVDKLGQTLDQLRGVGVAEERDAEALPRGAHDAVRRRPHPPVAPARQQGAGVEQDGARGPRRRHPAASRGPHLEPRRAVLEEEHRHRAEVRVLAAQCRVGLAG
eukprot:CAMPEP_0177585802 /NCGR_PEP_ID=MMETSP0419_2-20121207/4708_1 /TAXON_ID=582737 /ORGANISM="Tetraselmis sp., Strain GSL018" /LENGTH=176 /DNA_ID=CAMNT_0019075601 /DNA_START=21 /DNA_END=547 /DNA_ORIENTATION=+